MGLDARGRPLPSSFAMAAWDREEYSGDAQPQYSIAKVVAVSAACNTGFVSTKSHSSAGTGCARA